MKIITIFTLLTHGSNLSQWQILENSVDTDQMYLITRFAKVCLSQFLTLVILNKLKCHANF